MAGVETNYKDLPDNVSTNAQLALLPEEFLSDDPKRPLKYKTDNGDTYTYALQPLFYSVIFIMLIEGLERFSYYGIANTQTNYLTGVYNKDWNAEMSGSEASAFVSSTIGLAFTAPFLGGIIADGLLGDYREILFGAHVLYIPGLVLIALSAHPNLLGDSFSQSALRAGMILFPLGTGAVKSIVNVFGAKQFHPILQTSQVESYYVNFYMVINIGSLLGGIVIPFVAQLNVAVAYTIPLFALSLGLLLFALHNGRYVKRKPEKKALFRTLWLLGGVPFFRPMNQYKKSNGGDLDDTFVNGVKQLLSVIPVSALIIPFGVAYSQMSTVFILQGGAMKPLGFIDAAMMVNCDAISVLFFGYLIGSYFYPYLASRGIRLPITHKFAIGTTFAALAMLCSIFVDYSIHANLDDELSRISVLFQIGSYFFIGAGEIFTFAAALNAAFSIAPKEQKGLASALNLFISIGIPSFLCVGLDNALEDWFPTDADDLEERLIAYQEAKLYKFSWVILGICLFGIVLNLLPPVRLWVDAVSESAYNNNLLADASSESSAPKKMKDVEGDEGADTEEEEWMDEPTRGIRSFKMLYE